jgi:Zn-dependent peptidase ImmA (M78 family)
VARGGKPALLTSTPEHRPLFIGGTSYAAVLFGSFAPTIREDDVIAVSEVLIRTYSSSKPRSVTALETLSAGLDVDETQPAWTQGYLLAEDIQDRTGRRGQIPFDVEAVLAQYGIVRDEIALTDPSIRAISIVGEHHKPTVFVNTSYKYGDPTWVHKFSLAHEFGHLLIDRDRASRLAVASGPWAPVTIEKRANAFAVALLMPESEVRAAVPTRLHAKNAWRTINDVASHFAVSRLATIDRLFNLGYLEKEVRDQMRAKAEAEARSAREEGPVIEELIEPN